MEVRDPRSTLLEIAPDSKIGPLRASRARALRRKPLYELHLHGQMDLKEGTNEETNLP
jgi:hypothetical protein